MGPPGCSHIRSYCLAANLKVVPDAPLVKQKPRPLKELDLDAVLLRRELAQDGHARALEEANAWAGVVRDAQTELFERMAEQKAKRLPHPTLRIALKSNGRKLDKRESEFLVILDLPDIPDREKQEMVAEVPQPARLVTDAAALKKYAKLYGEDHPLSKIMAKALVYSDETFSLEIVPHDAPKKGLTP